MVELCSYMLRQYIPSRSLAEHKFPINTKCLLEEVNIGKKIWLICSLYNPHRNNIVNHLHYLRKGLDIYLKSYNILIWGNQNCKTTNQYLNDFCNIYNLSNLVENQHVFKIQITCFV